jgi:hypothetical protein
MRNPSTTTVASDHRLLSPVARGLALGSLTVLLCAGAYLAWVRGPAMLLDLAGSAFRAMCF